MPRKAHHAVDNQELFIDKNVLEPELCVWLRDEVDRAPLRRRL
ncbi:hypothetical protein ACFPOI_43955 [Nonomuraea angiospora]|uniref:Transposase n=1 Tax=Nonomuraea angiospora TaxID=46172 RepID=A0ABR9LQ86_9ACTN|nr:hypothetical protein [Nonomuraea angiospora]